MIRPLAALLSLFLLAAPASAWSYKEHVAFTRLAVQQLLADPETPDDMKAWLREVAPDAGDLDALRTFVVDTRVGPDPEGIAGLSYWAIHPDFDRSTIVPAFNTNEGPMHYVDLEFLNADPARQVYADDLSNLPDLDAAPRDPAAEVYKQAGYLPFRVAECYGELVDSIRAGRMTPDADSRRLDNAATWAGYLIHYLQDNTQPHHSTIDYKSASYFPDAGRRAPNVHGMMEYGFIDDEAMAYPDLRAAYFEKLVERVGDWERAGLGGMGEDPFASTLAVSHEAYKALPLIGAAARAAVEAGSLDEPDLRAFALHENADGVSLLDVKAAAGALATARTQSALRQAWLDARADAR